MSRKLRDLFKGVTASGQTVLSIGFSAALLLAVLFGFVQRIVSLEREQTYESFKDINSKIALSDEVRIRSLLTSLDKVLLVLRDDLLEGGAMTREKMLRRLNALKVDYELSPRVSFVDATGEVYLYSVHRENNQYAKVNVADRAYFQKQKAAQDDLLDFGSPVQSRISGKWVVPLSRRITNKDGSFGGILTMTVDPNLLTEPFEKTSLGANATRAIMGLDGYTLLRLNGDKVIYGGDTRKSQLYQEIKKARAGCYTAIASSDGVRRSVCYRVIDPYSVVILSGSAVASIESAYLEKTRGYIGAASLVALLIVVLAGLLIRGVLRQRKLVETQNSFNQLIEMVPQSICRLDTNVNIVWVNGRTVEYAGPSVEELTQGFDWVTAAVHPEDQARLQDFVSKASQQQAIAQSCEYRKRRFDGTYLWHSAQLTRTIGMEGADDFFLLTSTDIHDRKMAEERARVTQKLESIGQLTGGMAHDFNNLLAIIVGNLDLVKLEQNTPFAARKLDDAINAAQRGVGLVKSLLALASKQPLLPVSVDLRGLVERIAPLLRHALGPRINFEYTPPSTEVQVKIDEAGLEAVVLNLIVNARDAMPQGGSVKLSLQERDGMAYLSVADTGTGMSEAVLKRATEPFFTTKEQGHGTGLGLSTCAGFVKQSGGTMKISSTQGEGTTIEIVLPISNTLDVKALSKVNAVVAVDRKFSDGKLSILIVDDESTLADLVMYWARLAGHRAVVLHSADAALTLLAAKAFDVLLTDIVMPGSIDGITLAEKASSLYPGMKIVLMSGYSRETATNRSDVPWPLLVKPFGWPDLRDALENEFVDANLISTS